MAGSVFLFLNFLSVTFGGCFSQTAAVYHKARNSHYHDPSLTPAEWQTEEEIYWDNSRRQTGWGWWSKDERQKKKIDRHGLGKECRRKATSWLIRINTPKANFCQSPGSWKRHQYMKARVFSALSWSAKREVSHNIHLNQERPIQTQTMLEWIM